MKAIPVKMPTASNRCWTEPPAQERHDYSLCLLAFTPLEVTLVTKQACGWTLARAHLHITERSACTALCSPGVQGMQISRDIFNCAPTSGQGSLGNVEVVWPLSQSPMLPRRARQNFPSHTSLKQQSSLLVPMQRTANDSIFRQGSSHVSFQAGRFWGSDTGLCLWFNLLGWRWTWVIWVLHNTHVSQALCRSCTAWECLQVNLLYFIPEKETFLK